MKIVVDVPDDEYESYALAITFGMGSTAIRRILNGTPLPKGHGRIGDLDRVENIVCDEFVDLQDGSEEWRTAVNDAVENILHKVHYLPVIIEADKEYDVKAITRGNCMACGKELTEGVFFCKECEEKGRKEGAE